MFSYRCSERGVGETEVDGKIVERWQMKKYSIRFEVKGGSSNVSASLPDMSLVRVSVIGDVGNGGEFA